MEFRTSISIDPLKTRVNHSRRGLMLGSCFAESIAAKLSAAKFSVCKNPFGVLYNPSSIADAVESLAAGRVFSQADLCLDPQGLWVSFSHHGSFASPDPAEALDMINRRAEEGVRALRQADYVMITLGTAWIYELATEGGVVANCHKFPSFHFTRRRLSLEEVVQGLDDTIARYLPDKDIILTISPIRHIKDGLAENSRSKAILIEACRRVADSSARVDYFPSYEIMMDDLRDYRFYERDMVHPSALAVDYIWDCFCAAAMDSPTRELMRSIDRIVSASGHRPLHSGSEAHTRFRESLFARATELQREHPEVDLSEEIVFFKP